MPSFGNWYKILFQCTVVFILCLQTHRQDRRDLAKIQQITGTREKERKKKAKSTHQTTPHPQTTHLWTVNLLAVLNNPLGFFCVAEKKIQWVVNHLARGISIILKWRWHCCEITIIWKNYCEECHCTELYSSTLSIFYFCPLESFPFCTGISGGFEGED